MLFRSIALPEAVSTKDIENIKKIVCTVVALKDTRMTTDIENENNSITDTTLKDTVQIKRDFFNLSDKTFTTKSPSLLTRFNLLDEWDNWMYTQSEIIGDLMPQIMDVT